MKIVQFKASVYYCIMNSIIPVYNKLLYVKMFNDVVLRQISRKKFLWRIIKESKFFVILLKLSAKKSPKRQSITFIRNH